MDTSNSESEGDLDEEIDEEINEEIDEIGFSEGTVVPGTQLPTPYSRITAALRREQAGGGVMPSAIIGIDTDHERWIRQAMLDLGCTLLG